MAQEVFKPASFITAVSPPNRSIASAAGVFEQVCSIFRSDDCRSAENTTESSIVQLPKIEMTHRPGFSNLLLMVENKKTVDPKGMPIKYPEFASRMKKAMKDSGVSVTDIKTKLDVTYEMARRYALGQAMPRQEKMQALATLMHVDPSDLQFGIAEKGRQPGIVNSGWPFSIEKARFDRLPRDEKERVEGLIEHTITQWENKANTKSRRAS